MLITYNYVMLRVISRNSHHDHHLEWWWSSRMMTTVLLCWWWLVVKASTATDKKQEGRHCIAGHTTLHHHHHHHCHRHHHHRHHLHPHNCMMAETNRPEQKTCTRQRITGRKISILKLDMPIYGHLAIRPMCDKYKWGLWKNLRSLDGA